MTAPGTTRRCPTCFLTLLGQAVLERCPHCDAVIPVGWQRGGTTCIVMAGARYTGKSIFIGVMMKQLEQFAARDGMDLAATTRSTKRIFEERYQAPLYKQRGIMQATPSVSTDDAYQSEPLVFTLTARSGRTHHLVIRDVAGEDLEEIDEARAARMGYFREADFIFFMFDPLQESQIRTKLRDYVPAQKAGKPPKEVLDTVLDLAGADGPRMGVILSKFDAMQILRTVDGGGEWAQIMRNPGAAFLRDRGPTARLDLHDERLLHEEIRSLLLKLEATPFVASIERRAGGGRPGGHRYFAVSALGEAPDGQDLNPRGIAPFRCLDPLKWALADSRILG
jgi:hypothetical protein